MANILTAFVSAAAFFVMMLGLSENPFAVLVAVGGTVFGFTVLVILGWVTWRVFFRDWVRDWLAPEEVLSVRNGEWSGGRSVVQPYFCFVVRTTRGVYQGRDGVWDILETWSDPITDEKARWLDAAVMDGPLGDDSSDEWPHPSNPD